MSPDLGVITGLAREQAIADRLFRAAPQDGPRPIVVCAGASSERAQHLAERLCTGGVRALLSFGLAGALDPGLRPGDLVLASAIVEPHRKTLACDAAWRGAVLSAAVAAGGPSLTVAPIAGSRREVVSQADKRDLRLRSEAAAVDMESLAVAEAAAAAGLPFLALRAVADPAEMALPELVRGSIDADGRPRGWHVLRGLLARPSDTRALLRLARQSQAAFGALESLAAVAPALRRGFAAG